ncbi:hypothetical protein HN681_04940 [archaeon]|jgi:type I restriction enzyme, S subunit|nr:hypothetical protein [Candidatus Woesearchaeota archaeon]MBT6837682.1 hypothetical protein [Bacteroidota bacterium]MBT7148552.1 hypothetical protein [Candidatus Woesearchaeota archaeon]MBT7380071.1 hypothetical protein [archaeon]MBT8010764.1 hypothetical protein [archaeon]
MGIKSKRIFTKTKLGLIPDNWVVKKNSEVFEIKAGGDLKKLAFSKTKKNEFIVPIYSNSLSNKGLYGYSNKHQYERDCVTITARGDVGRAEYRDHPFCAIVRLLVLKPKIDISGFFIANFINSKLNFSHVGAAQNQLTAPQISNELIAYPQDIEEQQKIATILSNYDDFIENNIKRIELLENTAELIYDEWFVKFKFPGHKDVKMVESEMGLIPEGWEVKKVGDLIKRLTAGNKFTQDNVSTEGNIPVIDQSTKEILGYHNLEADHIATSNEPIMIFGDHTCKMKILTKSFSVGPNVIPFKAINQPESFVYFMINNLVSTREYKRHWNILCSKKAIIPLTDLTSSFNEKIISILNQISLLKDKNNNLEKTRDLLLPKLINGIVNVSNLDIVVPEVEA